jgi:hypothetical protein
MTIKQSTMNITSLKLFTTTLIIINNDTKNNQATQAAEATNLMTLKYTYLHKRVKLKFIMKKIQAV